MKTHTVKRQGAALAAGAARFEAEKLALPYETFQAAAKSAFRLVENREHWKFPIDATLQASARDVGYIARAVTFFTGSVPRITRGADGKWHIQADGYHATVGA